MDCRIVKWYSGVLHLLDDYAALDSCLDMYINYGKAVTPNRGRGQRISVKNTRYNSESDKENDEDESCLHIAKKVCLQYSINCSLKPLLQNPSI